MIADEMCCDNTFPLSPQCGGNNRDLFYIAKTCNAIDIHKMHSTFSLVSFTKFSSFITHARVKNNFFHLFLQASIEKDKLSIALEPEAASIFCRHLSVDHFVGDETISTLPAGTKYMVLDAGGT